MHWHFRSVMVDRVLAWEDDGRSHTLTKIQADLRKHWPTVLDKLARIEVKPCTVNTPRGKVQKWRIHIPDSQARLGQVGAELRLCVVPGRPHKTLSPLLPPSSEAI